MSKANTNCNKDSVYTLTPVSQPSININNNIN